MQLSLFRFVTVAVLFLGLVSISSGAIIVMNAASGVPVSISSAPALTDRVYLKISVPSGLSQMFVTQSSTSGNAQQLAASRGFLPETQFFGYTPIRWRSTINSGASATWTVFNTPTETYDYYVTITSATNGDYPINVTLSLAAVNNAQSYNYTVVPDGNPVVLFSGNSSFVANQRYAAATVVPKTQFDSISTFFITSLGLSNVNGIAVQRVSNPVGANPTASSNTLLPGRMTWLDVVPSANVNLLNSRMILAVMSTPRQLSLNTNYLPLKAFTPVSGHVDLSSLFSGSTIPNVTVTIAFTPSQSSDELYYSIGRTRWPTIRTGASVLASSASSIEIPVSGCSIDWTYKRLLVTVMYAPVSASDAQISGGSLFSSATVRISAPAASVTQVAPDTPVLGLSQLTSSAAAFDAAAVYKFSRFGVSAGDVATSAELTATRTTTGNCYASSDAVFVGTTYTNPQVRSACSLYTGAGKELILFPDPISTGNFTVTRIDATVIPTDGSMAMVNVSGAITVAKPASGTYPMVVRIVPTAVGTNAQGVIDVYYTNRYQCGSSNPPNPNAVLSTPQRCTFQVGQNPTPCFVTLHCPAEAIAITQNNVALSHFNISVVSMATTMNPTTFPQNVILNPEFAAAFAVNVPSGTELTVTIEGNATFPSNTVAFSPGGCSSTEFVNVYQPAPAGNGIVDITVAESGILSIRAPASGAFNFTLTSRSNVLCVTDSSLLPSACPADIMVYPIDTGAYTKATAEINIANYTDIAVKMGLTTVGSACYDAVLREACINEVPLCLPSSALTTLNAAESCAENCISRLNLASCPSAYVSQACAGLGACRRIPFATQSISVPVAASAPSSGTNGVPTVSGGNNPIPSGNGNTAPASGSSTNSAPRANIAFGALFFGTLIVVSLL